MPESLSFQYVLTPDGLRENQTITIGNEGRISRIADANAAICRPGLALPGIPNAHSHSFQRALIGYGEIPNFKKGDENFWSWRQSMYALANQLDEKQLYGIARQAFMEMLQAGFTSVAEFHYLHHDKEGTATLAMLDAIILAARDTGIRLRLLPVLYMRGGFTLPAQPEHYRFVIASLSQYCKLLEHCNKHVATGVAPHSLRAVPIENIPKLLHYAEAILGKNFPVHIHIAEQKKEVQDCLSAHHASPVQLLADSVPLTSQWNLIHATHINGREMDLLARAHAQVVLCPYTEAYLGDGVFPAAQFFQSGGRFALGTDSNTRIDALGEMRFLEYNQRLISRKRSRLASSQGIGHSLWDMTAKAGAKAVQFTVGELQTGHFADIVVLDTKRAPLNGLPVERMLDAAVIGGARDLVKEVYVGGKQVVNGQQHVFADEIEKDFATTMRSLKMV
ncbi:MAG: formimidoylglutamate deiminase [Gammaproteobacteria bacterium]|nr:formimidoylglutamate deiminase [Gammaproteobacteria bacterium]NNC97085.1 formimidoylglutamate deiminase [Gammaproteobacteria bacterium]NNM14072.1 formimidoylglutamate deiminase [Gammaproteobacteria bacterium]